MRYHKCVEEILGSKTKIRILRALHKLPEKEFSSRELAKFICLSHTAVLKATRELEGANIILVRTHGKVYGIRLNRKSVLAGMLDIFEIEDKLVDLLIEELKNSFSGSMSVAMFGSTVSGGEEPHSDIDLLVITENKKNAEKDAASVQRRIAEKFGNSVSPYILTRAKFKAMKNTALLKNIMGNNILVKGKKLEELQ
jgi:predicted nucleotidyltransferase